MSIRFSVISNSATYDLTPSALSTDEGSQVTVALSTTGVQNGQALPYTIYGTGITSADYVGLSSLDGEFVVQGGAADVQLNIAADHITEGVEQFTLALSNGAAINVNINDTSIQEGYALSHNVSNLNEGQSVIFTLDTVGVPNGTSVPYTISGSGITAGDFTSNSLTGNFVVNNNVATVTLTLANDVALEGTESFVLALDNGLATATAVTVYDTSIPTVTLTPSLNNVDEGNQVTITLNVTNGTVPDGTVFPYTISGTGISTADFTGLASLAGSFTVNSGAASVVLTTSADSATEGSETFSLALDNGMASAGVIINDTSTAAPVDPYAGQVVFNVNAYGGTAVDTAPVSPLHTVTTFGSAIVEDAPPGAIYPYSIKGQGTRSAPVSYVQPSTNAGDVTLNGDFTIEAWVKPLQLYSAGSQIIGFFTSASTYQYLTISGTGALGMYVNNPVTTAAGAMVVNTWKHFALVRRNGYMLWYVDGIPSSNSVAASMTTYPNFYIGKAGSSSGGITNNILFYNVRITKADRYMPAPYSVPVAQFSSDDMYWNDVVSLMNMNGTNGSTTFADEKGLTVTPTGVTISTTQSKFGGSSAYFNGTSTNKLSITGHGNAFVFDTTENFTVECWLYREVGVQYQGIFATGNYNTGQMTIRLNNGVVNVLVSTTQVAVGVAVIQPGEWTHLAVTRHQGAISVFINGVLDVTRSNISSNIISTAGAALIGYDPSSAGRHYQGYIDDFRVTKGVARYTSNFIPEVNY